MSQEDSFELDQPYAWAQTQRLSVLAGFPAEDAIRQEVAKALRLWCCGRRVNSKGASCFAQQQCKAIVDDAVLNLKRWRAPSQLKEIYDDLFPPRPLWGKDGPLE